MLARWSRAAALEQLDGWACLDCAEHSMRLADDAHDHRTQLHGLGGVLDLEYPALRRTVHQVSDAGSNAGGS